MIRPLDLAVAVWPCLLALTSCYCSEVVSPARDQVPSGFDFLQTTSSGAEFRFDPLGIPAGFLAPSSEPFNGTVKFRGRALPSLSFGGRDITHVDTIVERKDAVDLKPPYPCSAETSIQLAALALESIEPIEVRVGHHTEFWDVQAELSTSRPSSGSMTITKTHRDGGYFDSEFAVFPLFRFIRRCDGKMKILDTGALTLPPPVVENMKMRSTRTPWLHDAPGILAIEGMNDNFVAGAPDEFNEVGTGKAHGAEEPPECKVVIISLDNTRNICLGKSRKFKGNGSPAGGSYHWSIVQGGNKAHITAGANSQTVTVQADSPSATVLDIILKLDYDCPGGGTVGASIGLTAVKAELTFMGTSNSTASSDNQAAANMRCPPGLGPFFPGGNCLFWGGNTEIQAKITPGAGLSASSFDFKRTRHGVMRFIQPGGGNVEINSCLSPCDDEPGQLSEDVTLSSQGNIYVIDSPGLFPVSSPFPCNALAGQAVQVDGAAFEFCFNFEDRLLIDGQECGGRIQWHLELFAECQNGLVVNPTVPVLHEGGSSCAGLSPIVGTLTVPVGLKLMESDDLKDRGRAKGIFGQMLLDSELNEADRDLLEVGLLALAERRAAETDFASTLMFTLELLGQLKSEAAVPILLANLTKFSSAALGFGTPAARALKSIGAPALPAIVATAATATDQEWEVLEQVLETVEDTDVLPREVCAQFDANPNQTAEERLERFLTAQE